MFAIALDRPALPPTPAVATLPTRTILALDLGTRTGWAVLPEFGKLHTLVFAPKAPLNADAEKRLTFRLACRYGQQHTLGSNARHMVQQQRRARLAIHVAALE